MFNSPDGIWLTKDIVEKTLNLVPEFISVCLELQVFGRRYNDLIGSVPKKPQNFIKSWYRSPPAGGFRADRH